MFDADDHIPAAAIGYMESGMLKALEKAQRAIGSNTLSHVCGLRVLFTQEGDAEVLWDLRSSQTPPE